MKPDRKDVPGEYIYCPKCGTLHVDLGEWAKRPHHEHLCEKCGHVFDLGHYSFGINLPHIRHEDRTPYKCWLCHASYRTRGSLDEGEVPVRNVCVCELTATCDTCGAGFVVQRDVFDDREDPHYRCRACAKGLVDPVLAPVARTGPADLHDFDEHIEYYLKRDKGRFRCEACSKNHAAAKSVVKKDRQGYLFGCPGCGATELVSIAPVEQPVDHKKPSVHWRRRVRRPSTGGENE